MTDIAALGLSVDSSDVSKASEQLDRFAGTAKQAEDAAKKFSSGVRNAATGADMLAGAGRKAVVSAEQINRNLNVRDSFGTAERAKDVEAYGRSLDELRAKFNPLFAAEKHHLDMVKQVAAAQAIGALTQTEASLAILASERDYRTQATAIEASNAQLNKNAKGAALSASAMTNLGFQINDVATQAALGMDPLRILAAQGGQFYQILTQGEGGVRGSLGYIIGLLRNMITPFRLAVGAAAGFGTAAAMAASSWRNAQDEIQLALIGTGSAAGVTADKINAIAFAAAQAGKLTVGNAREMALAFASTGKVGSDLTEQLVAMSKGFGAVFGETASEGATRLARMFADPARGVDEINKRLASFDAATVERIKSLTEQGRRLEAQKLLIAGISTATEQAAAQTSGWANAWDRLTAAASEYWARAGRALDGATGGGGGLEAQLKDAQDRLARAQAGTGRARYVDKGEVAAASAEVQRLAEMMERVNKAAADAPAKLASLDYAGAIEAAMPNIRALKDATDALELLRKIRSDSAGAQGLTADQASSAEKAIRARAEEVDSIKLKIQYERTSSQIAKEDADFAMRSIEARTAAQRAQIAYEQTLSRERRNGNVNAEFEASAAKAQALAEASRQVSDQIRNRVFSAKQAVDMAALELSLVGKTADEQARLTAAFKARQDVQADSFRDFRTASAEELRIAEEIAQKKADIESAIRRKQLLSDIDFERSQIGRTQIEGSVMARMQSAGLLTDGRIVGAQNEAIAAQMRLNEQMQRSIDIQKEFAGGVLRDLMAGKGAAEALGNALNNLAQRMLDNSINTLFSGLSQSGMLGTGGGLLGGNILPGVLHGGGFAGNDNVPSRSVPLSVFSRARRYHSGGMVGLAADEVPAILQRGERVLSRREVAAGNNTGGVTIHIDARGAYPESIAEIRAALASVPAQIVSTMREARSRKIA